MGELTKDHFDNKFNPFLEAFNKHQDSEDKLLQTFLDKYKEMERDIRELKDGRLYVYGGIFVALILSILGIIL